MYFCYVDESGDAGRHDPANPEKTGSRYFILTGVIIAMNQWKMSLDIIKNFRKQLVKDALLNYDLEFHCSEIADQRAAGYTQLSQAQRWELIRRFAATIGGQLTCHIIAVVIDKTASSTDPSTYLTSSITAVYRAYDEFLQQQGTNGIVLFDRANEKHATTHVRRLMQTGDTGNYIEGIHIRRVIEDPIYRVSNVSMFIQAADAVAFTLKEKEFPISARKKFNADRIFANLLQERCLASSLAGEDGLIRL